MAEKRPISGINEIDIYSDLNDSDINAISALQKVLDSFPDYVLLIDEHHHIVMANDKICINTGKEPKNLTGKYCPQIIHGMNSPFPGCPLEDSLKQGCSVEKEIFDPAYKKWFLSCIYTTELRTKKNLRIYLHIIKDITEKKISQERIKYLSFHDKLTGLYNRAFFEEELIRLDVKRQLPLSLVIGDVNGLKLINDAFGHEKGDELLKKISKILKDCFRAEDIIARWGGDEFIIILPRTDEKNTLEIINRVKTSCKKNSTKMIPLSISLGIFVKKDPLQNIKDIIKEAEDVMYRHKLIEQQSTRSSIISSLEKALEERDYETKEHVKRMRDSAGILGKELKLSDAQLDELNLLATLHDIGKISIADNIILKHGKLTEDEWLLMKKHSEIGYRIAESSTDLALIAKGILHHHEWWNGNGYPYGLKGKEIPLISRIISIIDAYDAMIHDRPYRKAMRKEKALKELERCSGTQFDPELVEIFVNKIFLKK